MCRVVDVDVRSGWFRGEFRFRCPECRRLGFRRISDPGLHVG